MSKEKKLRKKSKLSQRWNIFNSDTKRIETSRVCALMLFVFVLIILSKVSIMLLPDLRGNYLSVIVFQILIFLLPLYIFIRKFESGSDKKALMRKLGLNRVRFNHILLIASASVLLICLSLGIDMLFGGIMRTSEGFSLYGSFDAQNSGSPYAPFYLAVTFALIPAFCEELMFRGFMESYMRRYGLLSCVLSSAVLYAMMPFSLSRIPAFLLVGIAMSFVMFVTGSVFACMIVHFIYNLFGVFMQANISNYVIASDNNSLFVLLLVFLTLISLAMFSGECARILRGYSVTRRVEPGILDAKFKTVISTAANNLANPYFIICLALYAVYSIVVALF